MIKDFNYTAPPTVAKFMRSNAFHRAISGPIGCTSGDTEFLTPTGWKRIDSFVNGDEVAQWNESGDMTFVQPLQYHVLPCDELIWFRNNSLSMLLSPEHRVPVYDWAGNFRIKTAERLERKPSRHIIPTTFTPPHEDAPVSDARLRLAVAINADGNHPPRGFQTIICVRKDRKKERLRWLLPLAEVEYMERYGDSRPTEARFTFQRWYDGKTFEGWHWWKLSRRQLQIVIEEMSYWDGLFEGPETRYHSNIKADADFIQYAAHAIGGKATFGMQVYPHASTLETDAYCSDSDAWICQGCSYPSSRRRDHRQGPDSRRKEILFHRPNRVLHREAQRVHICYRQFWQVSRYVCGDPPPQPRDASLEQRQEVI